MEAYFWLVPKDPMSFLTHFTAFLAAIWLTWGMGARAQHNRRLPVRIYCACLLLVYGLSATCHHGLGCSAYHQQILDALDHCGIILMIAGTVTVAISSLRSVSLRIIATIWVLAAAGLLLKFVGPAGSRELTAVLFVAMGALILPWVPRMARELPRQAVALLLAGGLTYVIAATMWAVQWPNLFPGLGHHEVMHVVVEGASFQHYLFVLWFVVQT